MHFLKWLRPFDRLQKEIKSLEAKVDYLLHLNNGTRATYIGNNRLLLRTVVYGANIAYLLESDDLLLTPWFVTSGQYEQALTNYFVPRLKPESRSIDVGANFGYFTCLFARFCPQGRVVGIEADQELANLARDNVMINGFNGFAHVLHAAAADAVGELKLHRRIGRSGNTSIAQVPDQMLRTLGEPESQPFTVQATTIDHVASEMGAVDFIKIDVEGAEPLVLKGAEATIARLPDLKIVMEWAPGQISAAGFSIQDFVFSLKSLDLQVFDIDLNGQEHRITFADLLASAYKTGVVLKRAA